MLLRFAYTLLLVVVSPFLLLGLYKKKPGKPAFGPRWKEHFGFIPKLNGQQPIWIHAVSVGESIAAIPIIKAIKQQTPEQAILVTTTTSTGAEQIAKLGELVEHRYMPFDFPWCVNGFLSKMQPSQMLIMETELWPNTLHCVAKRDIPITVLNARLSERSCQRYARFQSLFNQLSRNLTQVLCQYQSDAERFVRLGMASNAVHVTGSIKFDIQISDSHLQQGKALRAQFGTSRPVWIAASTHQGEDEIVLNAHRQLTKSVPEALLIIVPRHPERFASVADLATSLDFNTVTRTSGQAIKRDTQVYIGDTMGEMLTLLASADVCFMGGSLLGNKVGGHNLLEPAALKLPLLNGPSYFNFNEITQKLLDADAVEICQNSDQIAQQLEHLITNPELRASRGHNALQVVEENRGAVAKTLERISLEHIAMTTS